MAKKETYLLINLGHSFMVDESPTRDERVKETIRQMGPAVFNGGFSTFLAFALLRQVKYNRQIKALKSQVMN